ncbi:hypothetical protein Tco_1457787 [Tanacetum coccineum]
MYETMPFLYLVNGSFPSLNIWCLHTASTSFLWVMARRKRVSKDRKSSMIPSIVFQSYRGDLAMITIFGMSIGSEITEKPSRNQYHTSFFRYTMYRALHQRAVQMGWGKSIPASRRCDVYTKRMARFLWDLRNLQKSCLFLSLLIPCVQLGRFINGRFQTDLASQMSLDHSYRAKKRICFFNKEKITVHGIGVRVGRSSGNNCSIYGVGFAARDLNVYLRKSEIFPDSIKHEIMLAHDSGQCVDVRIPVNSHGNQKSARVSKFLWVFKVEENLGMSIKASVNLISKLKSLKISNWSNMGVSIDSGFGLRV